MLVSLWVTRVARSGIPKNGAMLHGTGYGALLPLQARLFVMRFFLATGTAVPNDDSVGGALGGNEIRCAGR
ncbi:hypothetical protein [Paracidovorax citrulli]